jgi:hypothetical protein
MAEMMELEPLVRTPVTTRSNVVAQKRLAFVLDWSGTAFTPVPEALGPAPQRMWLRGALRQCGGWRRTDLKEDPNAQAQIGTHKNIARAQEQGCSPQIRDAVESPDIDRGRPRWKQTSPAYYNAAGVVGCDGCRDDGGHPDLEQHQFPCKWHCVFDGIGPDEKIGNFGLEGGGAAGFELDRYDLSLGTPPSARLLAYSEGLSDNYPRVSEEVQFTMPHMGQRWTIKLAVTWFSFQRSAEAASFPPAPSLGAEVYLIITTTITSQE